MTVRSEFPVELRCPVDGSAMARKSATWLSCTKGHKYPVVKDIPVLLRDDVPQTICLARTSLELANQYARDAEAFSDPLFLDTLGISQAERDTARSLARDGESSAKADPVVSVVIAATSGYLYEHLVGALDAYPIPELRLPASPSARLLDVGCNWDAGPSRPRARTTR